MERSKPDTAEHLNNLQIAAHVSFQQQHNRWFPNTSRESPRLSLAQLSPQCTAHLSPQVRIPLHTSVTILQAWSALFFNKFKWPNTGSNAVCTTGFVEKRFIASGKKANEKDKFYCLTEEKSPWAQVKLMGFVCLTEAVAQCSARGLQITKGSSPPKLHTMLRCIWLLSRMFTKENTQEEEQLWCMWSSNAIRFFQNSNVQMYKWQNHSGSSL